MSILFILSKNFVAFASLREKNYLDTAIKIENLRIKFGVEPLFTNLCATVPAQQVTAIIGPNGAGKTTLILAILGFVEYEGTITFYTARRLIRFGYVPQRLNLPVDSTLSVKDLFAIFLQKTPVFLRYDRQTTAKAAEYLALVGLNGYLHRKLVTLSGGEFQRVMLAVNMSQNPDILILDEPAAGVDIAGGELFDRLLKDLQQTYKMTILMISHDLTAVNQCADHVICLNRHLVCEGPPEKALTAENLSQLFHNPALYAHHHRE
jgi:zinc transport system ATP-binding protein